MLELQSDLLHIDCSLNLYLWCSFFCNQAKISGGMWEFDLASAGLLLAVLFALSKKTGSKTANWTTLMLLAAIWNIPLITWERYGTFATDILAPESSLSKGFLKQFVPDFLLSHVLTSSPWSWNYLYLDQRGSTFSDASKSGSMIDAKRKDCDWSKL